jgi:hypothetical protein
MSSKRQGRGGLGLDRNPGPPLIVPRHPEIEECQNDDSEINDTQICSQNSSPTNESDLAIPVEGNVMGLTGGRGRRRGRIAMAANRTLSGWVTRKSNKEV